eukprot:TRINITY_DN2137_c0_g1_i1.p1 TRINITY_DN2137_c0_g1~~TRINITY_DN2137_c0_g1_i1.p1  ORF type:complete len:837 (+),score=142.68 TRINITY_DN2137_c0_g1_i1:235-2745(+)
MVKNSSLAQFKVLLRKNFILYYRAWRTTAMQLLAPFIFVVLLLLMQKIPAGGKTIPHPPLESANFIPRCVAFTEPICYTLMYTPNNDSLVTTLMEQVAAESNLTISYWPNAEPGSIVAMPSAQVMQDYILPNPNVTQAAVVFNTPFVNDQYSYTMWYNSTCDDSLAPIGLYCPEVRAQIQRAVDQAIMRNDLNRSDVTLSLYTKQFPLVPYSTPVDDAVAAYGILFFSCGLMFNFVITLYQLVNEKEKKLKMGMRMMGMKSSMFWASWFVTTILTTVGATLSLIAGGFACGFTFFLKTNFAILFLSFFSFAFALMMLAFFVSTLLSTTRQAVTVGMLFFIIGAILEMFLSVNFFVGFIYSYKPAVVALRNIFYLYPPFNFAKIVTDITLYSFNNNGDEGPGYDWNTIYATTQYPGGAFPPNTLTSFYLLLLDSIFYMTLAFFCENAVSSDSGTPRPFYFLFTNEFWGLPQKIDTSMREIPYVTESDTDPDVIREDDDAIQSPEEAKDLVRVLRLSKTYSKGGIFSKKEEVKALVDFSVKIEKGKLFCLLGHNGAGKTTTFNILTGLFPCTSGDATICGHSVINEMDEIRKLMGVCPQHDILWPELTAREHLEIFAELKGITGLKRETVIDELLSNVRLLRVGRNPVGTYSGGMKRRLSVAIASIGDPKVIVMDEPTTGMDPLSRRHVWQLIQRLKQNRIVLLTTHSMEEADVLGDRIGIMAKGRLRCIGNSLYLKNKFGDGFRVNLQAPIPQMSALKAYVASTLPTATIHTETGGMITYKVGVDVIDQVTEFFQMLENGDPRASFILEWGISNTTLEEVFFTITKKYYTDMDHVLK